MSTAPGPLGEEAARLVEALSEWARGHGQETPIATGSAECRLCPVCQLLTLMRQARPETFAHLLEATAALAAAARTVVESHQHGGGPTGVERIDLDDEGTGSHR
ncbi:MAG TPA: hypothetical protein VFJ98_04275 [Mycobacteriales bacterium]|nr:hypothetical protein [Mycobacteriales bacterium]